MQKMNYIIIFVSVLFFFSCSKNLKKVSDTPEIEDYLNSINISRYSYLTKYLLKEPSLVSINPDSSIDCVVINFEKKSILVPRKNYKNINLRTAYVAKSLYEYYIRNKYNIIDEVPFELRVLSAYFEIEYIINHLNEESINEIKGTELEKKLCSYLMDDGSFEKIIREEEDIVNKTCKRPSLELKNYIETIKKLKKSLNDIDSDAFFTVLSNLEIEKAKRGEETFYDAYRNYYYATSKPEMELYRDIRKEIYFKIKSFNSFNSFYKSEIKKLKKNRKILQKSINSFDYCIEIK